MAGRAGIERVVLFGPAHRWPVTALAAPSVELVDLRTSADTAGPPDRVVGYGAFVVT